MAGAFLGAFVWNDLCCGRTVRRCALVLPLLLVASSGYGAPALEAEVRSASTDQPIAGNGFRTREGDVHGATYGVPRVWLHGAELAVFGRGDTFAIGPMFGIATASGMTNSGSNTDSIFTQFRYGAEARATLSAERFAGWLGLVFGGVTTAISVPTDACAACSKSGRRTDWLLQPRVGAEYAIVSNTFGRIALGGWAGVEPFESAWHAGLLISGRLFLMSGPGGTPFYVQRTTPG